MKLAIVLPCYNEEESLEISTKKLTALFDQLIESGKISADSFFMFINDGSRDSSWDIICRLHKENKYVKGINLARNVGHQNAMMAGMMTARTMADGVISMDADIQDDINAIPKMIDHYNNGYDIVYGVKSSRKADPWAKKTSAMMFYKLQQAMGIKTIFNHADFRFMSSRALALLAEYHERNLYLRGIIPQLGLPSTTVDDPISEREAGVSKYTFAKMLNLALDGITSFSVRPIFYIIYLGIFFILCSLGIGIYVIHAFIVGTAVSGWASLILSLWLIGGAILISIGTIGVYIGKIYTEVKHRPLYAIEEILD